VRADATGEPAPDGPGLDVEAFDAGEVPFHVGQGVGGDDLAVVRVRLVDAGPDDADAVDGLGLADRDGVRPTTRLLTLRPDTPDRIVCRTACRWYPARPARLTARYCSIVGTVSYEP
jgi:hypothetical protein